MADGDPARSLRDDIDLIWESFFMIVRDWCQYLAARFTMRTEDYNRYTHLTRNLSSGVTPYSEFLPQMSVLLQNYRHLKVYWDVYNHSCMETLSLEDYPQFCAVLFYPVNLCVQLNIIPDTVYKRLMDCLIGPNGSSELSREQGGQHLELQADDGELQAEDGERNSEDSERTVTDSDSDRL